MSFDIDPRPILEQALKTHGQLSELFFEQTSSLAVVMDDGKVEKVISGRDRGAGLRLLHDFKTSYAHTGDLSASSLNLLAGNLAAIAQGPKTKFIPPAPIMPQFSSEVKVPPRDVETKNKVDLVRRAETSAREYDARIRQVRVLYMDRDQQVRIANSRGVDARDSRTTVVMMVHCVAEQNGDIQTGIEVIGASSGMELFEKQSPGELGRIAAGRAILMLEADPAPGGAMPVVLHSDAGGTMIHEAVGHGLEADIVNENMSVYAGRMGQEVANPIISVVDDATLDGKRGSFSFDDEGAPAKRNMLIENGVLKGYMHDALSALKMEAEPTGNGRRESFRQCPIPRMTNTFIMPGAEDPDSIIRATGEGLLVRSMGGGQVNTVNGDFVFEVSEGYLIKDGKIGPAVRGATLTGNGPQVLKEIDLLGNDLGFGVGTCGKDGQGAPVSDAQPTLRIPSIVVGGKQEG